MLCVNMLLHQPESILLKTEDADGYTETAVDRASAWLEGVAASAPEVQEIFDKCMKAAKLYVEAWDMIRARSTTQRCSRRHHLRPPAPSNRDPPTRLLPPSHLRLANTASVWLIRLPLPGRSLPPAPFRPRPTADGVHHQDAQGVEHGQREPEPDRSAEGPGGDGGSAHARTRRESAHHAPLALLLRA